MRLSIKLSLVESFGLKCHLISIYALFKISLSCFDYNESNHSSIKA